MSVGNLNGSIVAITGDSLIDTMTAGYRWELDARKTIDWSISNGWYGEYWNNPSVTSLYLNEMLSAFSYYANISFNYIGYYTDPLTANSAGSDINVALDSGYWGMNSYTYGRAFFPNPSSAHRGDIYINTNSPANSLSYEPGSEGWFFAIHEIGHALGLKHPHDDGGTGRPTFSQLGWSNFDIDFMTIMSYNDDGLGLTAYDPATPMALDVLALQYLYGKNTASNAGDTSHTIQSDSLYHTIWDASGIDTINQVASNQGWHIELPNIQLTTLVDTKAGMAVPISDYDLLIDGHAPISLAWLMGDLENVTGSSFSDHIFGNDLANLLNGGAGDDKLIGGGGNDILNGGDGSSDIAAYSLARSSYFISFASGIYTVTSLSGLEGVDQISNVEFFQFANQTLAASSLDLTAPTVTTFNPADAATGVAVGANIVLNFNEAILRGEGSIVIRSGSATGTIVETFDAASTTRLTISGSTLTVDPTSDLSNSTQYFVTFASGTVKDLAGNNYAGTTTYDFTTVAPADTTAPLVSTFSPADGATGVAVGNNIVLTFNEAIQKGTGTFFLRSGSATGTIVEQFDAATSTRITASGSTLTIDPTNNLANNTQYFVTFTSGSVRDLAGNIWAATGTDSYDFTTGVNAMNGTIGDDTLTGSAGVDDIYGDASNDILNGGDGDDRLDGGAGNDTLNGGSGNDRYIFYVNQGADTITDSSGTADVLDLRVSNTAGFALYRDLKDLKIRQTNSSEVSTVKNFWSSDTGTTAGTGYIESIELRNVDTNTVLGTYALRLGTTGGTGNDWIVGTTGSDTLRGDAGDDRLQGDGGNDTLNGDAGNDVLIGGAGNDTLNGGSGNDRYIFYVNQGADTITDSSGTADVLDLRVSNTAGFALYRDLKDLKIRQTNSSEVSTVKNFWSSDTGTTAGTGYIESIELRNVDTNTVLGTYALRLGTTGGTGNDWIVGTTGSDTLRGNAGDDRLQGDGGNDTLNGDAGNDVLIGGAGNDTLNGGSGNDRYIFYVNQGADTITDSSGTADVLDLRVSNTAGFALYRDLKDLKIRQTNSSEVSTVKNFWSSDTGTTAGTGYIESIELRNVDTNTVLGTYALRLGTTGGTGNDWIVGTTGSDTLRGDAGDDRLQGDGGNDTLNGDAGNDVLIGGAGNDTLNGGSGNDRYIFYVNQGADTITDSSGTADVLDLRVSNTAGFALYRDLKDLKIRQTNSSEVSTVKNFWSSDTGTTAGTGYIESIELRNVDTNTVLGTYALRLGTTGGTGNDWIVGTTGSDTLRGNAGDDRLQGDGGNDTLNGDAGNDVLIGGAGNDTLNGGSGNDRYIFYVNQGADTITDSSGTADVLDLRVSNTAGFALYRDLKDLKIRQTNSSEVSTVKNFWSSDTGTTAGTGYIESIELRNVDTNTVLGTYALRLGTTGGTGNDWIVGTTGSDTLRGDAGDDRLQGDGGNDTLNGDAGNDVLIGGAGNDTLNGGSGNDRYIFYVNQGADTITDSSGTADVLDLRVSNTAGFALYRDLKDLKIRQTNSSEVSTVKNFWSSDTGTTAGTGYIESIELRNVDTNTVLGTYALRLGTTGGTGNDWIVGTTGSDTLRGDAGDDRLQGDGGNDTLTGGVGNDVYVIDSLLDSAIELNNEGIDHIETSLASFDLIDFDHIENLTYTGTGDAYLIGSDIDNRIYGGAGNDVMEGGGGSDVLYGGAGFDILIGFYIYEDSEAEGGDPGLSSEILQNEKSNSTDKLYGGKGNDLYILDSWVNIAQIFEYENEGIDTIIGGGNYTLPSNIEIYINDSSTYSDGAYQYITVQGNDSSNIITTSPDWSNFPESSTPEETASFLFENLDLMLLTIDTEWVSYEKFYGLGGDDTLISGAGNDFLDGGSGDDDMDGGSGNDVLDGGTGTDTLTGGTGADYFDFTTALSGSSNVDTITDFNRSDDFIRLDNAVMVGLGVTTGALSAAAFVSGAGRTTAADTSDRIIYNTTTGDLYYDADGTGVTSAIKIALIGISTQTALDHTDFLII